MRASSLVRSCLFRTLPRTAGQPPIVSIPATVTSLIPPEVAVEHRGGTRFSWTLADTFLDHGGELASVAVPESRSCAPSSPAAPSSCTASPEAFTATSVA